MIALLMIISNKTVSKLYDKMVQSFNFPFPENTLSLIAKNWSYFHLREKNSDYLTKTFELSYLGKNMLCKPIDFLCKQNLVIRK